MRFNYNKTILYQIMPEDINRNGELVIPSSVCEIDEGAGKGLLTLKKVNLCNAKVVGSSAFWKCSNLTRIIGNPEIVKSWAFCDCESLCDISFSNMRKIENNAFSGAGFELLEIGEKTRVGQFAFEYCEHLKLAKIHSLRNISATAFRDCTQLAEIHISHTNHSSPPRKIGIRIENEQIFIVQWGGFKQSYVCGSRGSYAFRKATTGEITFYEDNDGKEFLIDELGMWVSREEYENRFFTWA